MITWKREAGSPDGDTIVYSGTSSFLVSYEVHSMPLSGTASRRFRAYRMVAGRRHPAAEGGEHRHLWAALGCAETDLRAVLTSRTSCGVLIRPLLAVAHIEPMIVNPDGYRWAFRPLEGRDYFPIDEPMIDLFAFYDGEFVCPCQQFAIEVEHGLTLTDLRAQAQWHIDDKHQGR